MRLLRISFWLFIFLGFPVLSARAELLDIQEVTSPGGITAWLVEDHSVPVIAIDFAFRGAGSINDLKAKQGLARMASNTMDEGAGDLNAQAFQKELKDQSISLFFGATRDHFTGSLKTLTKNSPRAFELLTMALNQPRFEAEAIERMRKANQSRIRNSLSDPEWMAARVMNDKAYEGHGYALNSGGTLSSLEAITRDDLKSFHASTMGKNNLVVAVSGDITADELRTKLDEIFGNLPDITISEPEHLALQNSGQVFWYEYDIPQTVIEIMQRGVDRHSEDFQTAQIMNFVLGSSGFGSRLTEEIREKRGLTYGIYSYLFNMDYFDGLSVSTSTVNASAKEVLALIKTEFERMAVEGISEKELSDAQTYLIGSLPLSLTSTDKIAGLMLSLQLDDMPIDYLDKRETQLKAVTIDDVQTLAEKMLAPESFVTVIVGKPEQISVETVPTLNTIDKLPNVE